MILSLHVKSDNQPMTLAELHERICMNMQILMPDLEDATMLVDECLDSAARSFTNEFILQLSAEAWARITLIYHKHFLDSGHDISVGEIISAVIRDSLITNRMDMVTLSLAQKITENAETTSKAPALSIVKNKPEE